MRRERIRKNRRRLYLTLTGIGAVVVFIGVFVWLVLRGAKVQGPAASSSAISISTTSTAVSQSFKSGTYTASGDVIGSDGNHHDLTVYVKLTSSKTYTRLIILDAHSQPGIINDTGDIKQKKGKLTLSSKHANVYAYASTTTYKHNRATTISEYAAEGASGTVRDYTTALKKELNNTITLKGKTPHNYRYLTTSLPLRRSKKKLASLDAFKTKQTASSSETSSATSYTSSPVESSHYNEPSSDSEASAAPAPSTAPSVESQHSQSNPAPNNNSKQPATGGNGNQNGTSETSPNSGNNSGQSTPKDQNSDQAPSPIQPSPNTSSGSH